MKHLLLAVTLALVAAGCAAETGPEPEKGPEPTQEPQPAGTAATDSTGHVSPLARPKCTDNPNGTTTCCTRTSCVTF